MRKATNPVAPFTAALPVAAMLAILTLANLGPAYGQDPVEIVYYFSGTMNDPFGTIARGTPFCGSFSYNSPQRTNTPLVPYRGDYTYNYISVTIGGVTVTDNGTGPAHVYDHDAGGGYPGFPATGYPTDMYFLYTFNVIGAFGGLTLMPGAGIQLILQDVTKTAFSGPGLMGGSHTLADFTGGGATFLELRAQAIIPPFPFPQMVLARGNLNMLSTDPVSCGVTTVSIDIKPGSDPNSINCTNGNETIPVAILTTPEFDALEVDHTTVVFGPGLARESHCKKAAKGDGLNTTECDPQRHEADVDGDGDVDLVLHFRLDQAALSCDALTGSLTGETFGGDEIEGSDAVRMVDNSGESVVNRRPTEIPAGFALHQNYPNPFNPATTIRFTMPSEGIVTLKIYSSLGEEVAVLLDDEVVAAGVRDVSLDAGDLPSGIYICRIVADLAADENGAGGTRTASMKMGLVK